MLGVTGLVLVIGKSVCGVAIRNIVNDVLGNLGRAGRHQVSHHGSDVGQRTAHLSLVFPFQNKVARSRRVFPVFRELPTGRQRRWAYA